MRVYFVTRHPFFCTGPVMCESALMTLIYPLCYSQHLHSSLKVSFTLSYYFLFISLDLAMALEFHVSSNEKYMEVMNH